MESGRERIIAKYSKSIPMITRNSKIWDMRQLSRKKRLKEQFATKKIRITDSMHKSLNRICSFLMDETNIQSVVFVDGKVLKEYFQYQQQRNFRKVSFTQTLKDIKAFLYFMENENSIKIHMDLRLINHELWLSL